jgi:hypothetical protein
MKKRIFVTFQVPGFHHWPGAPEKHAFLRNPHRHVFHVRVDVIVTDSDREIEFIEFKSTALHTFADLRDGAIYGRHFDFGARSCEMLAEQLLKRLCVADYQVTSVEVSEDGENGSRVEI